MPTLPRREFIQQTASLALAGVVGVGAGAATGAEPPKRKLRSCLVCGSIGVSANQVEAIELAHRHGFEAVEPYGDYLTALSDAQLQALLTDMKGKRLVFGAAGLPVEFR